MNTNSFLLYGANGYTGRLIARLAGKYGLQPVLAGRNEKVIRTLSEEIQLPFVIADLDNRDSLGKALHRKRLVLHAAGPFRSTARPMIEACLSTGTHYIDITGEIPVFEMAKQLDEAAKKAGIMLLPGVGFDVVPTDCLALYLKKQMPDAIRLKLAFATLGGGLSHGTALTMLSSLGEGTAIRENGKIILKPMGHKSMEVDFGMKKLFVMTIPWGDISTAYTSTGIPDIETYTAVSPRMHSLLKAQFLYNWLMRTGWFRSILKRKIDRRPPGPTDEQRSKAISLVWGEVENANGYKRTSRLQGPEGYTLTAHSSLQIATRILQGNFKPGYQTPATAYGEDLVLEIPGVERF